MAKQTPLGKNPRLSQVVAVEQQVKNKSRRTITDAYHQFQKPALLSGFTRNFNPMDEEGYVYPAEETRVQLRAWEAITEVQTALTELLDISFTKDTGNTAVTADVVIDGEVLIPQAPVPFLLFLEKQLQDLVNFVGKIPVLDLAQDWKYDPNTDYYRSSPVENTKTKKVLRSKVLYEATTEHPAQVESYYEDLPEGIWTKINFSGALTAKAVKDMALRVEKLQHAVKAAREEANSRQIDTKHIGQSVLRYLFGEVRPS